MGTRTVLVVDDDRELRCVVSEALRSEGYRVTSAATFAEAVEALAHTRVDLVLADALGASSAKPPAERWAVLEDIQARAGYTPVVIFTAHQAQDFAGYQARGFEDLLLKPFDLDELLALVARHAGAPGQPDTP